MNLMLKVIILGKFMNLLLQSYTLSCIAQDQIKKLKQLIKLNNSLLIKADMNETKM